MWQDIWIILEDAIFAAFGTLGFAYVARPPIKAAAASALLAAFAYGFRQHMILFSSFDIVTATFLATFIVGFVSIFFARHLRIPAEIISLPSIIPMIPGVYAYRTILSFEDFYKNTNSELSYVYLTAMIKNLLTTGFVTLALSVGIILSLFVFYEQNLMMTRSVKHDKRSLWAFLKAEF